MIQPPAIVKRWFDNYVWRVDTDRKEIFLTFDDGPIPVITPKVLNLLHAFDAEATFFCVGDNVRKHPKVYEDILKRGHSTGNHTYSHLNGAKTDLYDYYHDVEKAAKYIDSKLFRPPYGKMKNTQRSLIAEDYKIVLWDVLSYDFDKKISKEQCESNVRKFTRNGSVVVFHDNKKATENMFHALSQTLLHFSKKGYRFKKLDADKI